MPFRYLGVGGNGYIVQNLDSCTFLVTKTRTIYFSFYGFEIL